MRALAAMTVGQRKGVATTIDNAAAAAFIAGGMVGAIEHWATRDTDADAEEATAYRDTVLRLMPAWWPDAPPAGDV